MKRIWICVIVIFVLNSCAKTLKDEVLVYSNDFEAGKLENIQNGVISEYNGSKVLGNYNNNGFELNIDNLPNHNIVEIGFDLYIHDSWEGNQSFAGNRGGPDIWQMLINNQSYIRATFSNYECQAGNFCPPQSYPSNYPTASNNPQTGSARTDLPGFCIWADKPNGTTLYKIYKRINHTDHNLTLKCLDELIQKDVTSALCDESWSIDNINIKVIKLN